VLAGLVLVGMLLPRTFHSILIYPLLIFALLAAKNFYDDTQKQVPARDKTVHVFKTLVKVGLITVGVIIGFIILIIAAFAQSGV
jgi:fumarate reductase subunit C